MATAFGTLTTGAFLVGFVQRLGASDFWVNMLAAIPSLAGVLQIPGAIWGRSFRSYKWFVAPGGIGWRIFYIPLLFLPLAPMSGEAKLLILTISVAIASSLSLFVNPIYNEWISELIPPTSRGFAFSRRNAIAASVAAIVGILGAAVLDEFRTRGFEMQGFTTVYAMGLVCAAVSIFYFLKMTDIPRAEPVRQSLGEGIRAIRNPFQDPLFRRVLYFLAMFVLGQVFAGNLYVAFARESLGLDYKVIQGTAVAMAVGNVLSASLWGFLSDKYGNKPILAIVGVALALNPIPWILCRPGNPGFDAALLLSTHVLMGIIWGAVNLCQLNLILATAKPEDRANYIGAALTVTALVGGVGPLLGAGLMSSLRAHYPIEIAYKGVFAATTVLRLTGIAFLTPVRERGSTNIRETLKTLTGVSLKGVRAMRSLSKASDLETRESAIFEVGEQRMLLASDEIIRALHDPQPRVRRQAAAALARLKDPRAVGELVHQLDEHPDLLEEETIEALGDLGDPVAIEPLIRALQNPESRLRRSAARSLGRIGARTLEQSPGSTQMERAVASLVQAAADASDPDLRRAALQALRLTGAREASDVIAEALLDPLPSVRVAAAEAVVELGIPAAPILRISLERFSDESTAELAFALGSVGSEEDIPRILHEAARSSSMITRRRALLGVALQLGVQSEAYRLMLMGEMARDSSLLDLVKGKSRDRRLKQALESFSSGDELAALQLLASIDPRLNALAEEPVDEAFLIAIPYVAKNFLSSTKGAK